MEAFFVPAVFAVLLFWGYLYRRPWIVECADRQSYGPAKEWPDEFKVCPRVEIEYVAGPYEEW